MKKIMLALATGTVLTGCAPTYEDDFATSSSDERSVMCQDFYSQPLEDRDFTSEYDNYMSDTCYDYLRNQ